MNTKTRCPSRAPDSKRNFWITKLMKRRIICIAPMSDALACIAIRKCTYDRHY
ncbi:uncharacterized protein METZ01_LOCUS273667 [marine metagenome]|uniref:Uncharacterized protein n=1 Tax=marine metagenome TaxID=408172 RepID=A0A382KBB3_9ZZZZ